jgi:hypothetical protein
MSRKWGPTPRLTERRWKRVWRLLISLQIIMMGSEMVPETSVIVNLMSRPIAQEDFENKQVIYEYVP